MGDSAVVDAVEPIPAVKVEQPLRVIHVVTSLLVGGMEQFVLRLASEQRAQGHNASALGLRGGPLEEEARKIDLPTATLEGGGKASRLARAAALMVRERPHIVHAHNPGALPYALLGKLVGARVLMTRHGQLAEWNPGPLQTRGADAIVAVSGAAAQALAERQPKFRDRTLTILNGVQPAAPSRSREEVRRELGLDGLTGIIVARLDKLKGHEVLLDALARMQAPLTMLIAGDGDQRAALEARAKELGLGAERVRFLGYRADVADLLAASDLFVLPSRTEGLPLSVLEAMSHGLLVVATPVGGVPEALNGEECGLMVPVGDAEPLAAALQRLALDPELRAALGKAGYRRVETHFSFAAMTRSYEDLYRRLLRGESVVASAA